MGISKYSDLDALELVHIFDYYDFPLFFISKSERREFYLNYYIEELDNQSDKWFFARISNKEREQLIDQQLSVVNLLNKLLEKERLKYLYIDQFTNPNEVKIKLETVEDSNFDKEAYPLNDFYVEYDYVTKTSLSKIEEKVFDTSKFKLVIKDEVNSHDIDLNIFMNLMQKFTNTYNAIGRMKSKSINELDDYPDYFTKLRIDSLQPSSFGVWLKIDPLETDLFEIPEKSLKSFYNLLNDIKQSDERTIEESLLIDEEYDIEVIKDMKNFLKEISTNDFSFVLEAKEKTPQEETKKVVFNKNDYSKIEILNGILKKSSSKETKHIEIEGILTSINIPNNKFLIISEQQEEIRGSMSKFLRSSIKDSFDQQFKVPGKINAQIEQKIINDHIEEVYTVKNTMISFKQE